MSQNDPTAGDTQTTGDQTTGVGGSPAGTPAGGGAGASGADAGGAGAGGHGGGGNENGGNENGGNGNGGNGNGGNGKGSGGPQTFSEWVRTPPGEMLVGSGAIILTSILLMLLTVALLVGMTITWPPCNFPPETQLTPTPTPGPTSGAGNVNSNNNANGSAVNSNGSVANANAAVNSNNTNSNNTNSNIANSNIATGGGTTTNGGQPSAATSPAPPVDIDSIDPKSGSVLGNTPVTIKGKNLLPEKGLTVKFGESEAEPNKVTETSISVRTPKHSEGDVEVSVWRDGIVQDTLSEKFSYVCAAPEGSTLFWMLIMAGALGGCIHALRSLWWYTGQGTLKWKWMLMYFCLPFTGAAMAMLFSLLIVAGFVSNSTGRGESLFIIAVAGLVGMFTQQAALKLTDIANAFFTKPGEGKDSNPQPSLPVSGTGTGAGDTGMKLTPPSGPIAGNKPVMITATGFTDVKHVLFDGKPSTTTPAISADKTFITATPPPRAAGTVAVIVTNNAGDVRTGQYKYE